ncbi:proline-rich protein 36-like [Macrobrachium nipponense]|uniref:proline-rich protein 36-like n=1 Tax=Macrobrachium nipponense TaxID=159736 RepID=UPI0030C7EFCD
MQWVLYEGTPAAGDDFGQVRVSLGLQGMQSVQGLLQHLVGAVPVTHGAVTTTTTTVSTPGYAAPPHLVYTPHVMSVTPTATVQGPIAALPRRGVPPPPGFFVLTAPDFRCPKSSPQDLPLVPRMSLAAASSPAVPDLPAVPAAPAVSAPADVVPARGVAAPVAGPSGQASKPRKKKAASFPPKKAPSGTFKGLCHFGGTGVSSAGPPAPSARKKTRTRGVLANTGTSSPGARGAAATPGSSSAYRLREVQSVRSHEGDRAAKAQASEFARRQDQGTERKAGESR